MGLSHSWMTETHCVKIWAHEVERDEAQTTERLFSICLHWRAPSSPRAHTVCCHRLSLQHQMWHHSDHQMIKVYKFPSKRGTNVCYIYIISATQWAFLSSAGTSRSCFSNTNSWLHTFSTWEEVVIKSTTSSAAVFPFLQWCSSLISTLPSMWCSCLLFQTQPLPHLLGLTLYFSFVGL